MRRSKEDAEATRREILQAALKVFSEQGIPGATLVQIAERARVTRGAVYHHFEDKRALLLALIETSYQPAEARMEAILASNESPGTKLRAIARSLLIGLVEDPEYRAMEEILMFKRGTSPEEAALKEVDREALTWMIDLVSGLLREGQKIGEFRADLDVPFAASALISYVQGVEGMWMVDESLFRLERDADRLIDLLVRSYESEGDGG